jgi:hypothetical protein
MAALLIAPSAMIARRRSSMGAVKRSGLATAALRWFEIMISRSM